MKKNLNVNLGTWIPRILLNKSISYYKNFEQSNFTLYRLIEKNDNLLKLRYFLLFIKLIKYI